MNVHVIKNINDDKKQALHIVGSVIPWVKGTVFASLLLKSMQYFLNVDPWAYNKDVSESKKKKSCALRTFKLREELSYRMVMDISKNETVVTKFMSP